LHPLHHVLLRGVKLAFFEGDVEAGISDEDGGGHGVCRIRAGDEEKNEREEDGERSRAISKTLLIFIH
jgi:hypothetical protein